MAFEIRWYRYECDWCHHKVEMEGSKPTLPRGWMQGRTGIQFLPGEHFCGENCNANFQAADVAVGALSRDLARRIATKGSSLIGLAPQDFQVTLYHNGQVVQDA